MAGNASKRKASTIPVEEDGASSNSEDAPKPRPKCAKKKWVAKGVLHQELAAYIFEEDPEQKEKYAMKPKEFENTTTKEEDPSLRNEYKDLKSTLNSTGHGIKPSDVQDGTPLDNAIVEIKKTFPWWDDFHSFWMDLLNYNPIGVTNSSTVTAEEHSDAFRGLLAGNQDTGLKVDSGGLIIDGKEHEVEPENKELDHPASPTWSSTQIQQHDTATAYSHSVSSPSPAFTHESTSSAVRSITPNPASLNKSKKSSTSCCTLMPLECFEKSQASDQELFKMKQESEASMKLAKLEAKERLWMEELKAQECRDIRQLEFQHELQVHEDNRRCEDREYEAAHLQAILGHSTQVGSAFHPPLPFESGSQQWSSGHEIILPSVDAIVSPQVKPDLKVHYPQQHPQYQAIFDIKYYVMQHKACLYPFQSQKMVMYSRDLLTEATK
ncbi:hypothetical protein BS47DRAFT_1369582 [Hydnum rufescens UP504]|uniref:No apical meristem-associated C-terminal domain-containing protein n=1 Tax=Hydnum rufescens UP504 TaxID=1448309 RepID=A0A9P6ACW8_9AGAM|nr:hypothetical protein BS47DRAFT_1369582 [Hydnum rufescens UP504]